METKQCTRCEETKPLSEFNKNRNTKDGYGAWCRVCCKEWNDINYSKNREEILKHNQKYRREVLVHNHEYHERKYDKYLQHTYGITLREYDLMLESQGGGCAICGMTPEKNNKRLCVDHDHETGEVRGLLCNGCNRGLGGFRDNPDLCRQAEIYLYKYGK